MKRSRVLVLSGLLVAMAPELQSSPQSTLSLVEQVRDIVAEAGFALRQDQVQALGALIDEDLEPSEALPMTTALDDAGREVLSSEQYAAVQRAEAGSLLLNDGVEGLRRVLDAAGVPALTFNQETQIRAVHDDHVRALTTLRAAVEGSGVPVTSEIRALEEQLLLAALKFLNPAQRTALTGSVAAADFAELNDDLPEDEAELIEYLGDLRSPAATEGENTNSSNNSSSNSSNSNNGGGILIDGFSGGRMPNRDEIQEIRINENSFTSEQSGQSRGQTEVITRGGVGRWNGDVTYNFADESLDARNAFASSRPPYQQRDLVVNVSGPVIRNRLTATMSLARDTSEEGDTLQAITPSGLINDAVVRPGWRRSYTTRATAQVTDGNVLNLSYTWGSSGGENQNVGGFRLPEQGIVSSGTNFNFQAKETAVLSRSFNHEVQFRVSETAQDRRPITDAVHINVPDAFRSGGATEAVQYSSRGYEFGNLLMYTGSRLALRMGYDGNLQRIIVDSRSNYNGTFTFASLDGFIAGTPILFTRTEGNPNQEVSEFQSAAFLQSDIRVSNRLTLYFGARYEWQGGLEDSNNLDPRLGWAYSLGQNTVLRGGTGIFHQRLSASAIYNLQRFDGISQQSFLIRDPAFYPVPPPVGSLGTARESEIRVRADELTAPYTWNSEATIETSLAGGFVVTGSYRFIRGVHLFRSRNLNSPYDSTASVPQACQPGQSSLTCVRPDPTRGNINQLESSGTSSNHTLRIGFRQRMSFLNLNGSYDFNSNYDDVPSNGSNQYSGGGMFSLPADNFDLDSEWGRSGARHRFNTSFNVRFPWDINANTILTFSSGQPYTELTGTDDNQDTNTNDRPPGVPRNSLTGPGFKEVGLNLSKAIQLRSDGVETAQTGPIASGGYYGQRTGVRMTLSANVTNLLNNVNYQSFSGVRTSPFFGLPTRARDPRRMTLSVRFDF